MNAYADYNKKVVYRPFPTSNHNFILTRRNSTMLYIVRFLHQTTTDATKGDVIPWLYIVRFLHQTTTYHLPLLLV